jgi:hypothetical protein
VYANIGKVVVLTGMCLLAVTRMHPLAFWVEAVGFALVLSGLVMLRPALQLRYANAGKWLYWIFMAALLAFIYISWF